MKKTSQVFRFFRHLVRLFLVLPLAVMISCGIQNNAQVLDSEQEKFDELVAALKSKAKPLKFQPHSSHPEFAAGFSATIKNPDGSKHPAKSIPQLLTEIAQAKVYTKEELSRWYLISDGPVFDAALRRDIKAPLSELIAMSGAEQITGLAISVVREVDPPAQVVLKKETVFHKFIGQLRKLGEQLAQFFRSFFALLTGNPNFSRKVDVRISEVQDSVVTSRTQTIRIDQLDDLLEQNKINRVELIRAGN